MAFSEEMLDKIKRFAKQQSQHYLDDAELTYLEQLRRHSRRAKGTVRDTLAKLRARSDHAVDAENDMLLYVTDHMKELMAQGLSEDEAFERAREDLQFRSETDHHATLQEKFARYYETRHPALDEVIGLFYGAFVTLGLAIGGFLGFTGGGGRAAFLASGWVDTGIGAAIGLFVGVGLGLLAHAILVLRRAF